jgi:methylphosphotriester-DNA--protein-cysteine methyltransferase
MSQACSASTARESLGDAAQIDAQGPREAHVLLRQQLDVAPVGMAASARHARMARQVTQARERRRNTDVEQAVTGLREDLRGAQHLPGQGVHRHRPQ